MNHIQTCPHCKDEIPPDWVQQGGLHMGCYEEKIIVYFVSLPHDPDRGYFEIDINQVKEALLNTDEPLLITVKRIKAGQYYNAPEFDGF